MRRAIWPVSMLLLTAAAGAQLGMPMKAKNYVVYTAEPQVVRAGKAAVLQLRFHVMDTFHVNSHVPKSELLVPTALELNPEDGVKAGAIEYPPGKVFRFDFDPAEKLDVYEGDFIVKLPVVARAGEHTVAGTLKYQACDDKACYPPKTLPVQVIFTAK